MKFYPGILLRVLCYFRDLHRTRVRAGNAHINNQIIFPYTEITWPAEGSFPSATEKEIFFHPPPETSSLGHTPDSNFVCVVRINNLDFGLQANTRGFEEAESRRSKHG